MFISIGNIKSEMVLQMEPICNKWKYCEQMPQQWMNSLVEIPTYNWMLIDFLEVSMGKTEFKLIQSCAHFQKLRTFFTDLRNVTNTVSVKFKLPNNFLEIFIVIVDICSYTPALIINNSQWLEYRCTKNNFTILKNDKLYLHSKNFSVYYY